MSEKLPMLVMPSLLHPVMLSATSPSRSWIQLARTGSFVSNRYGKFAITKDDLASMLHNFTHITPRRPTQVPIDYDHLSMQPLKPLDGIAAGWLTTLELRKDGDELWGEVDWTPRGAEAIRDREYQFVSPSFVKDHVHKDGTKIGTTLLAAAITNHPFLEGMKALTLASSPEVYGYLGLNVDMLPALESPMTALHLSDGPQAGQRVAIIDNEELVPEMDAKQRAATYEVIEVKGVGDDAIVKIKSEDGKIVRWYPVTFLIPAAAPDKTAAPPAPMEPQIPTTATEAAALAATTGTRKKVVPITDEEDAVALALRADEATAELSVLAHTLAKDRGISIGEATKVAGVQRGDLVAARDGYVRSGDPATPMSVGRAPGASAPATAISLNATAETSFVALVSAVKRARQLGDREAISLASDLRPDLALSYSQGVL